MSVVEFRLVPPPDDPPTTDADVWDEAFPAFWRAYPRKVSKLDAKRTWRRVRPAKRTEFEEHYRRIMRMLAHFKRREWSDRTPETIPYPATWLNRQSFDPDDVDELCGK